MVRLRLAVSIGWAMLSLAINAATLNTEKAPVVAEIPKGLPPKLDKPLREQVANLEALRATFRAASEDYNKTPRNGIVVGSAQEAALNGKIEKLNDARAAYIAAVKNFNLDVSDTEKEIGAIKAMNTYVHRINDWDEKKKSRVDAALNALGFEKQPDRDREKIRQTWSQILTRKPTDEFTTAAAAGGGPGFPGAGTQSHQDCAVFALANASGRPYGLVAASATDLIRNGEWRSADERAAPQKTIEARGLNGGEVIILAETFGQATVVPSSDFAKSLQDGQRILINVVPSSGNVGSGHEIVLTKTFQHGGETWFAVMDSNQSPDKPLYLSTQELGVILKENGVMFQPEAGLTAPLLRE